MTQKSSDKSLFAKKLTGMIRRSWLIVLAFSVLGALLFWPRLVTAVPLTPQNHFDNVWLQAREVGQYRFYVSALQTAYPTPRIENVGRGPEETLLTADGLVNVPDEQMELNLWSGDQPLMLQIIDGAAYGRADANDEWVAIEDPDLVFAPGNDLLGFSYAATDIEIVDNWRDSVEMDSVTGVLTAQAVTYFTFDISGLRFAEYMRQQAELQMRSDGVLPPNVELGLAEQYVKMSGQGELWVNAQGLPVYQKIHLDFPAERGAMERVEAEMTTQFDGWEQAAASQAALPSLQELIENPQAAAEYITSLANRVAPPSAQTVSIALMNLVLLLVVLAAIAVLIVYRQSPTLHLSIALIMIFALVFSPLLQATQVHAASSDQFAASEAQRLAHEQQVATANLLNPSSDFNPAVDPLTVTNAAAIEAENSPSSTQLPASKVVANPSFATLAALQVDCDLADSTADCDGDGLANGIELYRLGTDPLDIDSDGDRISDATEVQGFNNGEQWYTNPLDADTNQDGFVDFIECANRVDIGADGNLTGVDVSNAVCEDTDGDGAPDVFDYDNDDDGVPDVADVSPNFTGTVVSNNQDSIKMNVSGYSFSADNEETLLVEYQIRPDNVQHLWQTGNRANWGTDREGQITIVGGNTQVTMTPMLEITIPAPSSNSANRAGSLPILSGMGIGDISGNETIDTWLDTDALAMYGVNVTQSSEDDSLLAYAPLTVVTDPVGDMAVAWSATMVYRPEVAAWGGDHEARVVWFISGETDYCDVSDMPDVVTFKNRRGNTVEVTDDKRRYEVWCSRNSNWVSNGNTVLQTYDDQFTLTGMNFTEFVGVETAVIAQTDALSTSYEDDMWRLANGLHQSFAQGKVFNANNDRFDIAEIKNRFDNDSANPYANGADELWGIDNGSFNILVNSAPDQVTALDSIGKVHIHQLLEDTYANPTADDVVTVMTLREQTTRSTVIDDSDTAVSVSGNTISANLGAQESITHASIQWGPYIYDGLDWDPDDIIAYLSVDLEQQLDNTLLDSHITNILDVGETINDINDARAGIISLARSYYIGNYQGLTSTVLQGANLIVDTSSADPDDYLVNDVTINLGADPAMVGVSNAAILLLKDIIEEELVVEVDDSIVAGPVTGIIPKIAILETFGAIANGTIEAGDDADLWLSAIEGSEGVLAKGASVFQKKGLKIDEGAKGWHKKSKTAATGVTVLTGVASFVGPKAGLSETAVLSIQLSLEFTSELLAGFDSYKSVKNGLAGVKVGYLKNLTVAKKAAKSGAVLGLIVDTSIIVGVTLYTIFSQDIEPGSIAFNTLIAQAIGAFVVAIISAVIAAIFPVGTIIIAIVGLIDFIIGAICAIIEEVEGDGTISDDVDRWVCGGISGAIAEGITEAIYDNYLTVDLNADDRLTTEMNRPVVNVPDEGYVPGTSVTLSMEVTTKLSLAPIDDGLIKRSFSTSTLRSKMRRSAFGYYLQTWERDRHDELAFGSVSYTNNQATFNPSITLNFNQPGRNQSRDVYFTESYNVVTLECWGFIFTSSATCDEEPTRDSYHSKVDTIVFDIFPATFDGFLGFLSRNDRDGDGLTGYYNDPSTKNPDGDGDQLSDRWELENGTNPRRADEDGDGLTDYFEVIYGTDPMNRDSDSDGIWDGDEFPRTQATNPFATDTQPWTGGWLITYDYENETDEIQTWVWADPLQADSDQDGMADPFERFYGYNPNVANTLNPVSLEGSFTTNSVQAGVVGISESINYEATVTNDDQFNTIGGEFYVEIPENFRQVTETISLIPEASATFAGISPVGDISASQYTSVTLRAAVVLDSIVDDVSDSALIDFPLDGIVTSGSIPNLGDIGGLATCDASRLPTQGGGGCPLFGDIGAVNEAASFNVRYPKGIEFPFDAQMEQNQFSLGLWMKGHRGSGPMHLIGREQASISVVGRSAQFSISANDGASCGTPTVLLSDTRVGGEEWIHIMGTYDGTTMRLYINGELDPNTATHTGGVCDVEDNQFTIGDLDPQTGVFRGVMDEVLFFGSALNQTQIDTLYTTQFFAFDAVQRFPVIVDAEGPDATLDLNNDLPNEPILLAVATSDDFSTPTAVQLTITSPSTAVDVVDAVQDDTGTGLWYFMFTPDIEGEYTVDMAASDSVGNEKVTRTFIYVDDTPSSHTLDSSLTGSVLTTNPDSLQQDNVLTLSGDITDNRTLGETVNIDVQDWLSSTVQAQIATDVMTTTDSVGTWSVDYLFPERAYGEYPVIANSADFVGNVVTETIGILQLDDFGPWADITINEDYIANGDETIFGTVTDLHFDKSGRIFHFHLDEGAGSTQFVDATQRKFVAICSAGECPTAGAGGQYGTAVSFDGINDRLEIAADDVFSMTNTTLMAWINPTWAANSNGYNPTILSVDDGTNTNFRWQIGDNYDEMILVTDSGTQTLPISLTPNEWSHVALVLENSTWTAYVNGIPLATGTQTLGQQLGLPAHIGATNASGGHFTGLIDEVVVYSHAILLDEVYDVANPLATTVSQLEIQLRHLNGSIWPELNPDGLKLYLPLDDPNGVTDFAHSSFIDSAISCDDEAGTCPTTGFEGPFSSSTAAFFDGNDRIVIPDTEDLDFEQMAVSFWFNADDQFRNNKIVAKGLTGWEVLFIKLNGQDQLIFQTPGLQAPNNVYGFAAGGNLTNNQWHHVVVMYDGEFNSIYINGNRAAQLEVEGRLPQTDDPLVIGAGFEGFIDEVAIFNRPLTDDEIQILYTYNTTWIPVTPDTPDSFYSNWSFDIPQGFEGLFNIGLRATDNLGNRLENLNAWQGAVDTQAPRLTFDYISLPDDNVQAYCLADDLNITDTGWVCPAGAPTGTILQASDWFVDYFEGMTRTVGIDSDAVTLSNVTTDGTMTACDLHDNCRTVNSPIQQADEGVAILSPVNGTKLSNYDPITISGFAWSDEGIRQANVYVNDQLVDVFQWGYSQNRSQSTWETTFTPEPGVTNFDIEVYLLTALYDGNGFNPNNAGVFIDEAETIIEAPTIFVNKTVEPGLTEPGGTVTFTVEIANNGLNSLNNVHVVDTLPAGLTPISGSGNLSETVDIPIGESVIFEIPVTVDLGQTEDIVNTVFVDHVTFSDQDSATVNLCDELFVVGIDGNFSEGLDNVCDGGTITFFEDTNISGIPNTGFLLRRPVTIDGAGYEVNFNLTVALASEIFVLIENGPYLFKDISFFKEDLGGGGDGGPNSQIFNVVGSDVEVTVDGVEFAISNQNKSLIANSGIMTIRNSWIFGSGGTNDGIENDNVMVIQNSTINTSINNSSDLIVEYSTLFADDPNFSGGEFGNDPGTSGITNSGTARLNANIMVNATNDCSGSGIEDLGYNIFATGTACPTDSGTSTTIDPATLFTAVIMSASDNGGNAASHALQPGSPALDQIARGDNDCGVGITSDVRGVGRPQNTMCEIGAYEVPNNVTPVAVDDSATTDEEVAIDIDVLTNDSDADLDNLTITNVSEPTNGTAVIIEGIGIETIRYMPFEGFEGGSDSFTYDISDGNGGTATATVNVTVNVVNDIPYAIGEEINTVVNTPIVIDVLANDDDEDALSIEFVTEPMSGTVEINGNQIVYTPPTDFVGTDEFAYNMTDGSATSNYALVEITINPSGTNNPPTVSAGDNMEVILPASATLNGIASDDGLPVTPGVLTILWSQISGPGTATFTDNADPQTTVSFSAAGVYILELSADDGEFTDSDQVTITVMENVAPVALDDSASTDENLAVTIDVLANDSDGDGDNLTVDSVTDPANGAVINNGVDVTYTPNADFSGVDSFDYTVTDGKGGTATATVTVTINSVNSNPVAADDAASTDEDTAVIIDVLANDSDADNDVLTIDSVTDPANGLVVNSGSDVTYTPDAGFIGDDTFQYTISDGNGGTATATVTVTVNAVNDVPVAVDDSASTDEDNVTTINVLANDSDGDGDDLTIDSVTDAANGSVVNNGSDVTYTPNADFNGADSFTYTVIDGNGGSATAIVTVTVNAVNDAPVAADDAQSTAENTAVTVDVLANDTDVDGDELTVDSVTDPANGTVVNNGRDVTYTPDAAFSGTDSFTYTVIDNNGGSATATVTITINNENDAPEATDDSVTTDEDVSVNVDVLANDSDLDGDDLTVESVTDPANGTVVNNGSDVTYTPDADFNGADSFTYTIGDGNGGSDTATVTVTVNAVNDNPIAADDAQSTGENTAVTIDVLANDMDVDGDALTIDSVTDPANGTVVNNGTDVTYTPDAAFSGTDSFSYTVIDNNGGSATATVTVTVNDVNDAPVAVDDAATTDENTAVSVDVLANDSDPDGDALTIDSVTDPANGSVVNNGTDVTYTPNAGFFGMDSFSYTVTDNNGGTATATVTVTVSEVNQAPIASDDAATTNEDVAITIDVLANDSDADNDLLEVESVTDPTNGTVVNNGTDVTYTPNAGFFGTDSFSYTVTDNNGGTATATVTVTVNEDAGASEADLSVTKTGSSETVDVESLFTYTIVVSNNGPDVATGVMVSDTLPAEVSFDSVLSTQGNCTEEDGDVVCELGEIGSGMAATVTLTVMPEETAVFTNTVFVSALEFDPDLFNNEDSAVVTAVEGFYCNGVLATIVGTNGNDTIRGTGGDDVIVGLGGDDFIDGRGGNDLICGGSGDDEIEGGNGNDLIKGNRGSDIIWGERGNDEIYGGRNADEIFGGTGADLIFGGRGDDSLFGNGGGDTIYGNRGEDYIVGGFGADTLYGGRNGDIIEGGQGADILIGNRGNDWLLGQNGNDILEGNDGWDDLEGGSGNDELYGGDGYDLLFGGSGSNDYCDGGNGFDEGFSCETEVDIP